ncbi:MAG: N-acetylmuramoyl-L-alanine amidase [Clostridia bacterium]|nr:N-acetylmuramoyl-L-alanine amidase [Clostridia bacterium]
MAKHFKEAPSKRGWITALIVIAAVAVVLGGCLAVANSGALHAIAGWFSNGDTTATTTTGATTVTTTQPPEPDPQYAVPEEMKGVWLTPGTDYLITGKESADAVKKQIDTAFEAIDEWQFNTVLLPLHRGTVAVYPSKEMDCLQLKTADGTAFEPIAYILQKARERKLFAYGVLELHVRDGEAWDPRVEGVTERTVRMAAEAAKAYALDGLFVSGFAFEADQIPKDGRDTAVAALDTLMAKVSAALTATHRDFYVGLMSNGIWAHATVDERGSDTDAYYEEFTDGAANTLSWLEKGWFHCVMVKNYASTAHPKAPFQKVLSWWDGVATKLKLPLYMSHSANTVGSYLAGWSSPDQLAQQYLYSKDAAAWCGSAYDSLNALRKDKIGTADTLKKAYAGTINEDFIYDQLKVTSPSKTTCTVTESTVTFRGSGDANFPLTINGEVAELSEKGYFTVRFTLKIGLNTFEIAHKGKTRTYKITYKQTLVESVSPSANMTVDGGSKFLIRATARKGSVVTALINNTTVKLAETEDKEEESGNTPSDFQSYVGSYTLPAGTIGQAKNLGTVKITATYNGLSETKSGGVVTIAALPVPTTTAPTVGSGGTTSGTPPAAGDSDIVIITSEYAETFNGGEAVDDWSRPYNSYLPAGTQDKLMGKVYNGNLSYYLLGSGKRVYQKDAKLVKGSLNENTALTGGEATIIGIHTVLNFHSAWSVPVYIAAYPQKYYSDTATGTPNYGIERYGQTAEYVEITFHYLASVPAAPDMTGNPLFSAAQWLDKGDGVHVLRLTLKEKGAYYGHQLEWKNDTLKLSFLNPVDISQNPAEQKLKGVRILLDPGHGSNDDKPWEGPFNLLYANELKAKLEALGATVFMTRDKDLGANGLSLPGRVAITHAGDYHMMISVHMNGFDGKCTGATAHYYDEVGYTLASYIYPKMHEVETPYGVGTTANGRPRASGTVWGTLYMNRCIFDCPSVLLECAFLDNPKDMKCLEDPEYRSKLMQAVADGVLAYFEAM